MFLVSDNQVSVHQFITRRQSEQTHRHTRVPPFKNQMDKFEILISDFRVNNNAVLMDNGQERRSGAVELF